MIKIISTVDDWKIFKPEWDKLYAKCNTVTPFQAFAFQFSSWTNMVKDGELHIITIVRDRDDALIAIFPTYVDKRGILRFINGRHIDFCSALVLPEHEKDYHLYEGLADYILAEPKIKGYDFDNLREDNYLSSILCYLCKGSLVSVTNHWSYFDICSLGEKKDFLNDMTHLSPKDRYKLKKLARKTSELSYKKFDIGSSKFPVHLVKGIINYMTEKGIRTEAYFSEAFLRVITDCYDSGLLTLGVSFRGEEAVSCNMCMRRGAEYINWLAIYKEGRENTLNLIQMMEDIHSAGGGVFNFARGIYDYKIHNFKPEIHNLYRIRYYKSYIGRFCSWIDVCIYYLKQVVKSIIRK